MDAKIDHISELSTFLGEKSSVALIPFHYQVDFNLRIPFPNSKWKRKSGTKSILLLQYSLLFRLCGQSIHQSLFQPFGPLKDGGKSLFNRFLTRQRMDWHCLLYATTKSFFHIVWEESVETDQKRYFILDVSTLVKTGFRMEGISRVFDHVAQKKCPVV